MGNQNGMAMSETTPPIGSAGSERLPEFMDIETRFGKVTVQPARSFSFRNGLLGFEGLERYCLTEFPMERMRHFKLLQSIDDRELAFITLPVAMQNDFIAMEDLREAARSLSIPESQLAVLMIVSVHRRVNVVNLSANARAPLLIDVERKLAYQHVFANNRYDIRHPLSYTDGSSQKQAQHS